MVEIIKTVNAPTPGNYNHAIKIDVGTGYFIFTAGQTGNVPARVNPSEPVAALSIFGQTTQALKNLEAVLESAGAGPQHIIKTTVFLENLAQDKVIFESAYAEYFKQRGINKDRLPARSTVGVVSVPLADEPTIVEIEAVAYIPKVNTGTTII